METILGWQIAVALSIVIARIFSPSYMILTAIAWSAFSVLAIWTGGLLLLQLGTAWVTVWLLSELFGEHKADPSVTSHAELKPSSKPTSTGLPKVEAGFLAEFTASVEAIEEAHKANSPLHRELYPLRIWVESVVKTGERRKNREIDMGLNPEWAERHHKSAKPTSLPAVTIAPVPLSDVPRQALSKRICELEDVLRVLTEAEQKTIRDPALVAVIERDLTHPLLPFIAAQKKLIREHLDLLVVLKVPPVPRSSTVLSNVDVATINVFDTVVDTPIATTNLVDSLAYGANVFERTMKDMDRDHADRSNAYRATERNLKPKTIVGRATQKSTRSDTLVPPPGVHLAELVLRSDSADKERLARELRIPHLVHFTRCENLPGILEHGLMSVQACGQRGILPVRNDAKRYDGQTDGTSLSIAFPNYSMFWKYRQLMPDTEWAVLLIDPSVLWLKECAFYPHNAADARMIRQPRTAMKSVRALSEMFSKEEGREPWLRSYDPTYPQAEVMVYQTIEPGLIEAIAFETSDVRSCYYRRLGGIDSFYAGPGEGLFASRRRMLRGLKGGQDGI